MLLSLLLGTGSGSLTHALIRRVRPHGHVHTFDFHEHRAKLAQEEFEAHGLADFVSVSYIITFSDSFIFISFRCCRQKNDSLIKLLAKKGLVKVPRS